MGTLDDFFGPKTKHLPAVETFLGKPTRVYVWGNGSIVAEYGRKSKKLTPIQAESFMAFLAAGNMPRGRGRNSALVIRKAHE